MVSRVYFYFMKLTKQHKKDLLEIRAKLEEVADEFSSYIDTDLCGACGLGMLLTWRYFKSRKYNPVVLYCKNHCLIQVENLFIDLTATQYGYTKLFTGKIKDLEQIYSKQFVSYSHPGLLRLAFYSGWKNQDPYWLLEMYDEINKGKSS